MLKTKPLTHLTIVVALILLFFIPCSGDASTNSQSPTKAVSALLDTFHKAAERADGETYFQCMTEDAYFLGTDATEYWTKKQFISYCKPYFDKGRGWKYISKDRNIRFSPDRKTAWFFERLFSKSYGELRGSGVLTLEKEGWKIAQYNMAFTIPNRISRKTVEFMKAQTVKK